MAYVIGADEAAPSGQLGGKGAALAALRRAGIPVPPFLAVTPEAFYRSLGDRRLGGLGAVRDQRSFDELVGPLAPVPGVRAELARALGALCPRGEPVAVRSSAADEDGARQSFAGQLESFLCVAPQDVADRVAAVWRSAFTDRVLGYRRQHGLPLLPEAPAVLVQRMVNAEVSGVAMSADPVTGRRGVAVVGAACGLGAALVSGACDGDTYHVDRAGRILTRHIAARRLPEPRRPACPEAAEPGGVSPDVAERPALTDAQIVAVARLAREAERHFGRPQDIEWAIEAGQLYLLQSRPLTALAALADPDGSLSLWDNSNIAESYAGVTTPLTFSFARRAYEEVYRQFCRMMGVPAAALARHEDAFGSMLGLIQGRVYYNLLAWYRVLALLPGFSVNRRFMEQMMGVKGRLPEGLAAEVEQATRSTRLADAARLVGTFSRLLAGHLLLGRRIRAFHRRVADALGPTRPDLSGLRADELVARYRELERRLLMRWDAPLLNDFLTMIFCGLLGRLTARWCGDAEGTLARALLAGESGLASAAPAARMAEMARLASVRADLLRALCEGTRDEISESMGRHPDFLAEYRRYLDDFGDRSVGELKLESPTLVDDPAILLRAIGGLGRSLGVSEATGEGQPGAGAAARRRAEQRMGALLSGRPVRRLVLGWALHQARARVRDRESLRFERTRVFARARLVFLELGRRLSAAGLLGEPREVFYLEVGEILGFVEGTTSCTDLRGLVALRQSEFRRYRSVEPPADRFETRGVVHLGNTFRAGAAGAPPDSDADQRRGLGCSPGIATGPVRVVRDPRQDAVRAGEILVAERTDPGWVMLFPLAAGLLVEHGSPLSHSAVVARELGLPTVISLPGVTRWLTDGDRVELDGSTGVVTRLGIRPEGSANAE